jgi:hypothetical protein
MGNTDEMLVQPDSLEKFASQSSAPPALWRRFRQIALATHSTLGDEKDGVVARTDAFENSRGLRTRLYPHIGGV